MKKIEYSKGNPKRTAGNEMFPSILFRKEVEPRIRTLSPRRAARQPKRGHEQNRPAILHDSPQISHRLRANAASLRQNRARRGAETHAGARAQLIVHP